MSSHKQFIVAVAASLTLFSCAGEEGAKGPPGEQGPDGTDGTVGMDGTDGTNGMDGMDGMDGVDGTNGMNGMIGADGVHCWDLNGDGVQDANEDINTDTAWDALDCQPAISREVVTGQTATVSTFQQTLTLTCSAGKLPYGGGHRLVAANNSVNVDAMVTVSMPTADGWNIHAHGDNAATPSYNWRIEGFVICGN